MDWKTHGVKIVRPDAFDAHTHQKTGMTRTAAITRARNAIRRQRSAFRTGPRGDRAHPLRSCRGRRSIAGGDVRGWGLRSDTPPHLCAGLGTAMLILGATPRDTLETALGLPSRGRGPISSPSRPRTCATCDGLRIETPGGGGHGSA